MTFFDTNILDEALTAPNIQLTIPLPIDDAHPQNYLNLANNFPVQNSWRSLINFIDFFTGYNLSDVYSHNEYYYSVNKFNPKFKKAMDAHVNDKLENLDQYLDELIYQLLDQELNLNLISSKDLPKRFQEVKKFLVDYYKQENSTNFPLFATPFFIRICYVTVIKLLKLMFPDGIWCNNQEISDLYQQYIEDPASIIYLPCHKSHVDYIILHILTIRFQLATPTVIAGNNLNVAVFGKILKKLGAIFIKRSFNNELYTEKNLNNLLEFLVSHNVPIEVFIEGTRSRDGKVLLPKYGILKMFQNIYDNTKKDMILQPLSITYERIYETDGYLKELIGKDKKQESFGNIIKNGVTNLFAAAPERNIDKIIEKNLPYDNLDQKLSGKMFIKFGENFRLSLQGGNLKQIGFKLLHEINKVNYLPEISIVGAVLQLYYYDTGEDTVPIKDLIPLFRLIVDLLKTDVQDPVNLTNIQTWAALDDAAIIHLFKYQIIKFFKFITTKDDKVFIKRSVELLYYKNSIIHLVINKSVVSFVILNSGFKSASDVDKVHTIVKTLLKNEFLFDYNNNHRDSFDYIISDLIALGKIDTNLKVKDQTYLKVLSLFVEPFLKSYTICIQNIILLMEPHKSVNEKLLINNQLLDFPDTKKLLKLIQKNSKSHDFESYNKQYLLSCLYYLNHLKLIRIFKNKSKTKAYVKIENPKDLTALLVFLQGLFGAGSTESNIEHLADVVELRIPRLMKL